MINYKETIKMFMVKKNDITSDLTPTEKRLPLAQTKLNQTKPKPRHTLRGLRVLTLSILFSFFASSVAATTVLGEIHWKKQKGEKQKNYLKYYNMTKDLTYKIWDFFVR